jgi:cation-transporting ATPase 13A2
MIILSGFNVLVLMAPPKPIQILLTLQMLPMSAKITLLAVVSANIAMSLTFEQWGSQMVGNVIGTLMRWWQRGRRRVMEGKVYKAVEGGMR